MTKPTLIRSLLSAACLVLAAPTAVLASPSSNAPATAGDAGAWKHAVAKHGGSGVAMSYTVPSQLPAGQASPVELRFDGVGAAGATATVRLPEGVSATRRDGGSLGAIALTPGTTTVSLLVRPAADGLRSLAVFTEQAGRRSAHTIRLRSGDTVQAKPASRAVTTPSGEKIVPLKSQPR